VAAFEWTMLTSTASHKLLPWGTAEEQWCCNGKLIVSACCEHCSCCHLQHKARISLHLLYFYRIPIFVRACVRACVCICPFFLSSFLPSSISYLLTIWHHSYYIIL
jgi:hypothetical protein